MGLYTLMPADPYSSKLAEAITIGRGKKYIKKEEEETKYEKSNEEV